jgi:toxin-antitoxin system PIN domain toxin
MNRFLLDVNVLIALIDPSHVQHDAAHRWFHAQGKRGWATCPFTENGVLRIVGNPRYPNSLGTPAAVAELMTTLRGHPGHAFWPDDITLFDPRRISFARLLDSSQVSDSYLLALAKAHSGRLATFDRRLVPDAVIGGSQALSLIS